MRNNLNFKLLGGIVKTLRLGGLSFYKAIIDRKIYNFAREMIFKIKGATHIILGKIYMKYIKVIWDKVYRWVIEVYCEMVSLLKNNPFIFIVLRQIIKIIRFVLGIDIDMDIFDNIPHMESPNSNNSMGTRDSNKLTPDFLTDAGGSSIDSNHSYPFASAELPHSGAYSNKGTPSLSNGTPTTDRGYDASENTSFSFSSSSSGGE